jgi:hypothetical protein
MPAADGFLLPMRRLTLLEGKLLGLAPQATRGMARRGRSFLHSNAGERVLTPACRPNLSQKERGFDIHLKSMGDFKVNA